MERIRVGALIAAFFLAASGFLFAAATEPGNDVFWYNLEQGKNCFRQGDFGSALLLFEDARNLRRTQFYRAERALIDTLSLGEVRRFNDDLSRLEQYVADKQLFDAKEALASLYYYIEDKDELRNSSQAAVAAIRRLREYPEADYWIAEVYRFEGELALAANEYHQAYDHRASLENPGFATTILYRLAETEKMRENYTGFEAALFEVLKNDTLWNSNPDSFTRRAMKRTLENDGIERYITMYRNKQPNLVQAHRMLGEYYYQRHNWPLAEEHLGLAFLYATTTVIDEVKKERYDWQFTSMLDLMADLERKPELRDFLRNADYDKTIYLLGSALAYNQKIPSCRTFWAFLADYAPNGDWGERARANLGG